MVAPGGDLRIWRGIQWSCSGFNVAGACMLLLAVVTWIAVPFLRRRVVRAERFRWSAYLLLLVGLVFAMAL